MTIAAQQEELPGKSNIEITWPTKIETAADSSWPRHQHRLDHGCIRLRSLLYEKNLSGNLTFSHGCGIGS